MSYAMVRNTGSVVRNDPAGSIKALLFLLLGIVLIFVVFKFLKGFSAATELISDFGPTTETKKEEIINNPVYTDNIKWLGDDLGAKEIGKQGLKVDSYLSKVGSSWSAVSAAADQIWKAKIPGYISETEVYNAIALMPTKTAVSLLALNFNSKYANVFGGAKLSIWLPKYLKVPEMDTLTKLIAKKKVV